MNFKMKKLLSVLLVVCIILCGANFSRIDDVKAANEQTDILFIGNSMTYYNELQDMFQGLANKMGKNVKCSAATNGSKNLIYQSTASNVVNAIKKGGYEIVILQDIVSSFNSEKLMTGAKSIIATIKQYNPNARIVFYEPWPKKPDLVGKNSKLPYFTEGYINAARTCGATLAPAGEAFYDGYVTNGYDFYVGDGLHPAPMGSFTSAATIYYTIYENESCKQFTSSDKDFLNSLVNANTSDKKTYDLELFNNVMKNGHKYARAIAPTVADKTGKTGYTCVKYALPDPTERVTADLSSYKEINLNNAKIIDVSSSVNSTNTGDKMIDGKYNTRWESVYADPQYVTIELDKKYSFDGIKLYWETAASKQYTIETSADNVNWTTVFEQKMGNGGEGNGDANRSSGLESIKFDKKTTGKYVRIYSTARTTGYGVSLFEVKLFGTEEGTIVAPPVEPETTVKPETPTVTAGENIAKNKEVVASGIEGNIWQAKYAVDGNTGSRWSSNFADDAWIYIDLGNTYSVSKVVLKWEAAYGKAYDIQVSTNGTSWTTVKSLTNQNGGEDIVALNSVNARYVKMQGVKKATAYGYSLWEMEVYAGAQTSNDPSISGTNVAKKGVTSQSGNESSGMSAKYAVDGNKGTRWSSNFADDAWMSIDLGKQIYINKVIITWEAAYGKAYDIQVSNDGTNWTTVAQMRDQDGGEDVVEFNTVNARYVRFQGIKRAMAYGYSMWEFEVVAQ